jgi:cytochrome c oxidase subunit 1
MAFAGMSLYMVSTLLGKPVHKPGWAMWTPWVWLVGVALFSTAGSINGLRGEPRRTNLGMTYLNPDSPLFRPEWRTWAPIMALGGILMFVACVMWFRCFFGTLLKKAVHAPELDFPESEALHQGSSAGWVGSFRPWVVMAVLLILISYVPPLLGLSKGTFNNAPGYSPESPVAQE